MKKLFFLILTLNYISLIAKADTIDYWHVYYNNRKIKEFNQNSTDRTIILGLQKIKAKDSLAVRYFNDTPCMECDTFLEFEDSEHNVVMTSKGKGTSNPISFSLKRIIDVEKKINNGSIEIYYFEASSNRKTHRIQLFKIVLSSV